MVTLIDFRSVRSKFLEYTLKFLKNEDIQFEYFKLKQLHSLRVSSEILRIGRYMGLNDEDLTLARIIGILHDIGRFEQFSKYGTFIDEDSENHSETGVRVIHELGLLRGLPRKIRDIVYFSILNHNTYQIDNHSPADIIFFSKMIRDADKIDILKQSAETNRLPLIDKIPEIYSISNEIYDSFLNKKHVMTKDAKNQYDHYLLRVSWIFDLNYLPTFLIIQKRGYLPKLLNRIPMSERLLKIQNMVIEQMMKREVLNIFNN